MVSSFRVVEHIVKGCHTRDYVGATAHGDVDMPVLAVKQYVPVDNPTPEPGDVTIIGAHANGFPKVRLAFMLLKLSNPSGPYQELYEPLWDEIHERASRIGVRIRSIWIADMWNQGKSGVLNESILGNDPSWADHARDLMNLINQKQDLMPHPIVGIGHSMGGTQLSLLALFHPRLLRSLVLIDPVIQVPNGSIAPAISSTPRRDVWPSREAAVERFKGSKFFQAWDPRVLEKWIEYGLRDIPTELHPNPDSGCKPVTLTTSKHQELFSFLRPTYREVPGEAYLDKDPIADEEYPGYPFYRPEPLQVFRRLPELRPSVLYLFGDKSELSTPAQRKAKMARTGTGIGGNGGATAGRVKDVVLACGHLVCMEKVAESADAIAAFLSAELDRWREEKHEVDSYRNGMPRKQQITIDDRWAAESLHFGITGQSSAMASSGEATGARAQTSAQDDIEGDIMRFSDLDFARLGLPTEGENITNSPLPQSLPYHDRPSASRCHHCGNSDDVTASNSDFFSEQVPTWTPVLGGRVLKYYLNQSFRKAIQYELEQQAKVPPQKGGHREVTAPIVLHLRREISNLAFQDDAADTYAIRHFNQLSDHRPTFQPRVHAIMMRVWIQWKGGETHRQKTSQPPYPTLPALSDEHNCRLVHLWAV
ncbi:toxin biosynthesis protein [Paramyrothecium foliicola]|nr:toxin biosynthesis protein [Paramyrothecium foliicola]